MKLPKSFTSVTKLSKIIALILFISLPFIGFYLGVKYQQSVTVSNTRIIEIVKIPTSVPTNPPTKTIDNRTPLTFKLMEGLDNNTLCEIEINQDETSSNIQWLEYSNKEIQFSYPYNPNWGNQQYQVPEIDNSTDSDSLYFGTMSLGIEGCGGALRAYRFSTLPNKLLSSIKLGPEGGEIKHYEINGYQVVEHMEDPGMLYQSHVYFQGKNKLYRFDKYGSVADDQDFQTIIKSFKLL